MKYLKNNNFKWVTAAVLVFGSLSVLLVSATASAALVGGNATFVIDNDAVAASNPSGWFFENHWGANDNTLKIEGSTTGGTALSATGSSSFIAPVNTNTSTLNYPSSGRTTQATTMDASSTSVGQIGLSGALRLRDPSLTTYLAPYDFSMTKTAGDWKIMSTDNDFGTVGLFTLTNVAESLNGSGELLLSGDLLWTSGFGYAGLLGANTSTVVGSFNLAPSAVPVPAAVWLFGSGLIGLLGVTRKKSAVAA